eukprot:scaffold179905_cov34-Tisochrysis_lutea.AAC.2
MVPPTQNAQGERIGRQSKRSNPGVCMPIRARKSRKKYKLTALARRARRSWASPVVPDAKRS